MKLAAVLLRGEVGIHRDALRCLSLLHLGKKNACTVFESSPSRLGMLKRVKDYVAFGTITDETYALLIQKRGQPYAGSPDKKTAFITVGAKRYKPFFRLHPPRGGFERKGIKVAFATGGSLGDRGEAMDKLVRRML